METLNIFCPVKEMVTMTIASILDTMVLAIMMAIVLETVVLTITSILAAMELPLALIAMGIADDCFNCNGNCVGDSGA
eukprot:12119311-Ditylum_brightwellii.AAC.1